MSIEQCISHYNITVNCTVSNETSNDHPIMGGVLYGKFQGDADIAGVGVSFSSPQCPIHTRISRYSFIQIWYAYFIISCIALVVGISYFLQSIHFGIPMGEHGVRYRPLDGKTLVFVSLQIETNDQKQ